MRCQFIHDTSESQKKEIKKVVEKAPEQLPSAPLKVDCQAFEASVEIKATPVAVSQSKLGAGAIQAASGTGGLGNKQTATALANSKIVYKDIFIHNLHVSIQEFQKKQKMY